MCLADLGQEWQIRPMKHNDVNMLAINFFIFIERFKS